jgi:hypothetical protein
LNIGLIFLLLQFRLVYYSNKNDSKTDLMAFIN